MVGAIGRIDLPRLGQFTFVMESIHLQLLVPLRGIHWFGVAEKVRHEGAHLGDCIGVRGGRLAQVHSPPTAPVVALRVPPFAPMPPRPVRVGGAHAPVPHSESVPFVQHRPAVEHAGTVKSRRILRFQYRIAGVLLRLQRDQLQTLQAGQLQQVEEEDRVTGPGPDALWAHHLHAAHGGRRFGLQVGDQRPFIAMPRHREIAKPEPGIVRANREHGKPAVVDHGAPLPPQPPAPPDALARGIDGEQPQAAIRPPHKLRAMKHIPGQVTCAGGHRVPDAGRTLAAGRFFPQDVR